MVLEIHDYRLEFNLSGRKVQKVIFAYSTVGIQLALFLVLFTYGGYKLDVRLGTSPLFILVGAMVGLAAGLYNLLKGLKEIDRYLKKTDSPNDKRRKWL
ncbi:MAG: AtpZ/AtpI family protein [Spirochaetes bacterium]|nr:AtpZ/AtpI family protein [Spirochaetota bacterium]